MALQDRRAQRPRSKNTALGATPRLRYSDMTLGLLEVNLAVREDESSSAPLRPEESTQSFFFMVSDTPCRFFLTTSFLTELRPCFWMLTLPPLERAMTDEREVVATWVTTVSYTHLTLPTKA